MRARVLLLPVILLSFILISTYGSSTWLSPASAAKTQTDIQPGSGRFISPARGQSQQATLAFTVEWELDNPNEVAYQDLTLSTNGGATFDVDIAAYLSPGQRQLKWSTLPRNATPRARLQIVLHEADGDLFQIVSDDFSITHDARAVIPDDVSLSSTGPAASQTTTPGIPQHGVSKTGVSSASDITNSAPPTENEKTREVEPNFAGTGSCEAWDVPNVTLDYNMGSTYTKCGSVPFTGEPAVAQNPNDPKHFVLLHNNISPHKSTEPNTGYGYSPQTKVGPLLQAASYSVSGDPTVEITSDGSVYAVTLGFSSFNVTLPDTILIFRSTDGGLNFSSGVPLPKPAGVQFVDKPVMDVHKNNPNILAITVNPRGSDGFFTGSAYVVICTSASTLSNFTVVQPLDNNGNPVKPYGTLHTLIDPIAVGSPSYWLFLVYTNDDLSGGARTQAGMTAFQYQVTGSSLGNGGRPINSLIRALPGNPPLWSLNPNHTAGSAVEKCLRMHDSRFCWQHRAWQHFEGDHRLLRPERSQDVSAKSCEQQRSFLKPLCNDLAV